MTVGIHQPNFLPWIGYFYKIYKSDVFVILDDVQYTKNSFINRNRIKSPAGEQWLTMPVLHSGKFGQSINEVDIQFFEKNFKRLKNSLHSNYAKSTYFKEVMVMFEQFDDFEVKLSSFNEYFIRWILDYLEIKTQIFRSSELINIEGESTDRLISICKQLHADKYLAGFGSKKYQEDDKFLIHGIDNVVYDFTHPQYNQLWGEFIPNLSIIDILFNAGKDTSKIICT